MTDELPNEPNPDEPESTVDVESADEWEDSDGPSWWPPPAHVVAATTGLAVVAASYLPEFRWLVGQWSNDPNYSHGFLVVPVALAIYWQRRGLTEHVPLRPWHLAWPLLLLMLAARAYFYETGNVWIETATLLPALLCLALSYGGWAQFRRAWPAVLFLAFMLPLPARANTILAQPLQTVATRASTMLLPMTGLWVIAEGNVIYVNDHPLEVAEACNGLSMLMCLAATVAAWVILVPMPGWKRAAAAAAAVPIALVCNIIRITATAWAYQKYGAKVGGPWAHDVAGWLMMPTAVLMVALLLGGLSWMIVEEDVVIEPTLLGRKIRKQRVWSNPAIGGGEQPGEGQTRPYETPTALPPAADA